MAREQAMSGSDKKRHHRILVIEDSPIFQKLLKTKLEDNGYQVFIARDGLEGLRLARENKTDLIFLDMMLPGMDGQQVCRLIKGDKTLQDTPLIMLTSRDSEEFAKLAKEGGVDVFIGKTTRIEVVLDVVEKLLKKKSEKGQVTGSD